MLKRSRTETPSAVPNKRPRVELARALAGRFLAHLEDIYKRCHTLYYRDEYGDYGDETLMHLCYRAGSKYAVVHFHWQSMPYGEEDELLLMTSDREPLLQRFLREWRIGDDRATAIQALTAYFETRAEFEFETYLHWSADGELIREGKIGASTQGVWIPYVSE